MRKLSSQKREEFCHLVFAEHERSGSTARKFCKREGLSEPSFYAWRSRLRSPQTVDRGLPSESGISGLVPVKVTERPSSAMQNPQGATSGLTAADERVEIAMPGGFVLRVREEIESRCLSSLLRTVVGVERGSESC